VLTAFIWLRIEISEGSYEPGYELSDSIEGDEFLD
jgi:hypothetical protein